MNYEDMIDLDINANITAIENDCGEWEFNGVEFYHCGVDGNGYHSIPVKDYCNNPSDAWSIIELIFESGVTLMVNGGGVTTRSYTTLWQHQIDLNGGNKLRAAMIVYLMMNEEK